MASDTPRRFVVDTNTLVSAFLFPESKPSHALRFVLNGHTVLMSLELAAELTEVFRRPRFDRYLSIERREELVAGLIRASEFVTTASTIAACRDASDNRLLELAVDGRANAILTGDADLLVLHPFRNISILNPGDFLSIEGILPRSAE